MMQHPQQRRDHCRHIDLDLPLRHHYGGRFRDRCVQLDRHWLNMGRCKYDVARVDVLPPQPIRPSRTRALSPSLDPCIRLTPVTRRSGFSSTPACDKRAPHVLAQILWEVARQRIRLCKYLSNFCPKGDEGSSKPVPRNPPPTTVMCLRVFRQQHLDAQSLKNLLGC